MADIKLYLDEMIPIDLALILNNSIMMFCLLKM